MNDVHFIKYWGYVSWYVVAIQSFFDLTLFLNKYFMIESELKVSIFSKNSKKSKIIPVSFFY